MPADMLAPGFAAIRDVVRTVVAAPMPTLDTAARRYYRFLEALHDWENACQAYDSDYDELHRLNQMIFPADGSAPSSERFNRYIQSASKVRFDIRCFYVFGKIAFVTYAGLLFPELCTKSPSRPIAWSA